MGRKIIDATIKTQDNKGHISIFHTKDIVLESIVFKADKKDKKEDKPVKK